ncbi:MAG: hypothetical protein LBB48_04440 [Treponema sp.]|jgi:hypothetical protein|nr:hypothetical protein [Treponema sp.]
MKNWLKFFGIIAVCAVTGLSLAGCEEDKGEDIGTPPEVKGVQLYTLSGQTFTAYTGAAQA